MTESEVVAVPLSTVETDTRPTLVLSLAANGALEVEKHPLRPMPTVQQVAAMAAIFQQDVHTLALAQTVTALFHQAVTQQAANAGGKVALPGRSLAIRRKSRLS